MTQSPGHRHHFPHCSWSFHPQSSQVFAGMSNCVWYWKICHAAQNAAQRCGRRGLTCRGRLQDPRSYLRRKRSQELNTDEERENLCCRRRVQAGHVPSSTRWPYHLRKDSPPRQTPARRMALSELSIEQVPPHTLNSISITKFEAVMGRRDQSHPCVSINKL